MGKPQFQAEKQGAVSDARGTDTRRFNNTAPATPPAGASPFTTKPYSDLRVRDRYDGSAMEELGMKSATFRCHMAMLAEKNVSIDYEVVTLPPDLGGGTTGPSTDFRQYLVKLDPATVWPGFHIFEVFLHEHGHIDEYHRVAFEGARKKDTMDKRYLPFMHAVEAELGLRLSADSHLLEQRK